MIFWGEKKKQRKCRPNLNVQWNIEILKEIHFIKFDINSTNCHWIQSYHLFRKRSVSTTTTSNRNETKSINFSQSVKFIISIGISTEQMRSNRGVNFANDLDLYTNEVNECRRQILSNVLSNTLDHHQQITTENGNFNWTALLKENYRKYILCFDNFDIYLKMYYQLGIKWNDFDSAVVSIDRMKEITSWIMQLNKKQQLKNYQQNVRVLCTLMAKKRNNNKLGKNNSKCCDVSRGLKTERAFGDSHFVVGVHLVLASLYRR